MTPISNAAPTRSSFRRRSLPGRRRFPRPRHRAAAAEFPQPVRHPGPAQCQHSPSPPAIIYGTVDRTFTDSTSRGVTLQVTGNAPLFGLANYFTAGFSVDAQRHRLPLHQHPGTHLSELDGGGGPGAGRFGQHHPRQRQYRLCPGQSGRHHQLLRLLCRRRAGPDRCADRDRGPARQRRRHRHPRPQRLGGRTERQPRLWPCQSAGGRDLQARRCSHAVRRLFRGQPRAHAAGTGLRRSQPALPAGRLAGGRSAAGAGRVAHSYQAGVRGDLDLVGAASWTGALSLFRTDSDNDIVALASTLAGRGYFTNVPSTQRQGVDLSAPIMRRRAGRPMPAIPIWMRPISSPARWPRPTIPMPTPTAMWR